MRLWRGLVVMLLVGGVGQISAVTKEKTVVQEVRVEGTHLEQTSRCNKGGAIRVVASDSRLLIAGDCTAVVVEGMRNYLQVEHAGVIRMIGGLNTVMYQDPGTRVDDRGRGNTVAPKWPQ